MSFETEAVLDRRRLRRRLSLWRAAGRGRRPPGGGPAHLLLRRARRPRRAEGRSPASRIEGLITEDRDLLQLIKKIGESKKVAAVILFVNSPGGTTAGGEALFEALRDPRQDQAGGGAVRHGRDLGRLHCRPRHRPDHRARQHHHRLGRRHLPVAGVLRAAREARHQDERDQERPAQGQSVAVPAARRARQGRGREDGGRIQALVRGPGADPARHRHRRAWRAWSRGASSPGARR